MWYFAFGSNIDAESLSEYLRRNEVDPTEAKDPRRALLRDYQIRTNYQTCGKWGAANIEVHSGGLVEGVLMEISPAVHAALRRKE
jgi:hypothetical protein